MSKQGIRRREFIRGAGLAGLSAPLLARERVERSALAPRPLGRDAPSVRPVVISSPNGARPPGGRAAPGSISCVQRAMEILKGGGDTLDAVVAGVNIVEDDPTDWGVGYGGLPNDEGDVELDACVMHGPTRRAGAVASLRHIKNPSKVARLVMERTDHILLVGEGALRFALKHGFKKEELLTEEVRKVWLKWREELSPSDDWGPSPHHPARASRQPVSQSRLSAEEIAFNERVREVLRHRPTGTINCLAVDAQGDISGVTTTSGLAFKVPGRVGDSPLIGCGLYVDNAVGAAGATGRGEECIYINGSHTVVENMRRGMSPTEAALDAVKRVAARYGDNVAELRAIGIQFYAVNKRGEYGAASLWKGSQFAVHDGKEARLLDSAYLLDRTARKPIQDRDPKITQMLRSVLLGVLEGKADPARFAPPLRAELFPDKIEQGRKDLTALGPLRSFQLVERDPVRRAYSYRAVFGQTPMIFDFVLTEEGQIAELNSER
jgi:N4-(beta-N-acetylglucosaminyl)-L-asparaginase